MGSFKVCIPPAHTISAFTADDVLAGYFVKAMSLADVAATDDWEGHIIVEKVAAAADSLLAVGIAMASVTSGNIVSVATDGVFQLPAEYAVTAGNEVGAPQTDPLSIRTASYTCTGSTNALQYIKPVGMAWSTGASGEQILFKLNL